MEQQSGSASLPDNWEEVFKEMTAGVIIEDTRRHKDMSNFELAERITKINSELRGMSEMIQARTPRGVELHDELTELDEELRIRDFK